MVLALVTLVISVLSSQSRAQYDESTQPPVPGNFNSPVDVSTCGYGQFVTSSNGNGLQLIGNDGRVIATTDGITSAANVAIATDHWSDYAIVTASADQAGLPIIQVRLANNHRTSRLSTRNASLLESSLPDIWLTITLPPDSYNTNIPGPAVFWISAVMDASTLVVTWQTNTRRIGYAAGDITWDGPLTVTALNVLNSQGQPATGSIPTISCNRWVLSGNTYHIAFAQNGAPRNIPTDYQTGAAAGTALVQPANQNDNVYWVRVATFEDPVHQTAQPVQYFYGVKRTVGGSISQLLYTTDGVTINPAINPITSTLFFEPNAGNPVPPMAMSDDYHVWHDQVNPSSDNTRSVFCVYKHYDDANPADQGEIISICRQDGTLNAHDIYHGDPNVHLAYYTLGANQMGIFSLFDHEGIQAMWRSYEPIFGAVLENTIASGLTDLSSAFVDGGVSDIRVMPFDTLRIFGDKTNGQSTRFRDNDVRVRTFPDASEITYIPVLNPFTAYIRSHIIFDNNTAVDFQSKTHCGFIAEAHGSIEYDGSEFKNMNLDVFGGGGVDQRPDTTTFLYRGIVRLNAKLALSGGSTFVGHKTLIQFAQASSDAAMALLSIDGAGSSINWDSCLVEMGSTSTTQPLTQIVLNTNSDNYSTPVSCTITNSRIVTNDEDLIQPDPFSSPGTNLSRSDILIKKPGSATITNCRIGECYVEVWDPVSSVTYDGNTVFSARQALNVYWDQFSQYSGTISASNNLFAMNYPIGHTSANLSDIVLDNFRISGTDIDKVRVQSNVCYQYPVNPPSDQYTAISFTNGTNGGITSNLVRYKHHVGIHTKEYSNGVPFVCNNEVLGDACCAPIDIGILQDGPSSHGGYTKLNLVHYCGIGYESGDYDNSNLVMNTSDHNSSGVLFSGSATTILYGNHWGTDNYAGYNQVTDNSSCQVEIQNSATPSLGQQSGDQTYGQNMFTAPSGVKQLKYTSGGTYTLPAVNEISQNQWSPPIAIGVIAPNGEPLAADLGYTNNSNVTAATDEFSCGGGWDARTHKNGSAHSLVNDPQDCYYYNIHWPDSLCLYEKGLTYENIDPQKGLDTMMRYCEEHPYATYLPGRVLDGINWTGNYTQEIWSALPYQSVQPWVDNFNWLVKMQPRNMDVPYQKKVIMAMASDASNFDWNLSCNILYNWTLLFPDDSGMCAAAWDQIRLTRGTQSRAGDDTTAFYKMSFPIQPLGVTGENRQVGGSLEIRGSSDQSSGDVHAHFVLLTPEVVSIALYDVLGKSLISKTNNFLEAGDHDLSIDARSLPSGAYYLRVQAGLEVGTTTVVIVH